MITSASIVSQSPPPAPQASSPPPDTGSGQDFSDVLSQTQSAQRPASGPPPASAGSTPPATKTDGKGSAKADGKAGKKVDVKKSDDPTETDSDADPADVAISANLPGNDSSDGHSSDAKPQEKGAKTKATDVTPTPHPSDAQTTVPIQVAPDSKVKVPGTAKDSTAKEPASQEATVVAADSASSAPPATAADQKSPSGDSLPGTDPTTPAPPAKGAPGTAKLRNGKILPADPTASDSSIDPSAAVASATVGAFTDDPAESDSVASDTVANSGSVAPADHAARNVASLTGDNFATPIVPNSSSPHSSSGSTFVLPTPAAEPSAEAQFGQTNYPQIVSAVHGQLLPGGGSMQLRLDPPELGAVHINVQMRDGAMTATFEASNEQAVRLLSHSLGDLKTSLESQGVNVEAIHVKQSTTSPSPRSSSQDSQQQQNSSSDDGNARREEQRQQMIRRMWKRLSGGDPLDMVA